MIGSAGTVQVSVQIEVIRVDPCKIRVEKAS